MKVGDEVKVKDDPKNTTGKVIRFYANQGTVLVELAKDKRLVYYDYKSLVEK